jgi:hypothetical protein
MTDGYARLPSPRLNGMTKINLTLHRERLLALRARLRGDVTQMEDSPYCKMGYNLAYAGSWKDKARQQ